MQKKLLLLSFILIACSCHFKKHSIYKGYIYYTDGIYYKYADLGIKKERISEGKIMEVFMSYSRMNDSVFLDSRKLWYPFTILLPYDSIVTSNSYQKILFKLNEGDSINFIIKKDLLFGSGLSPHYLAADSMVKVNIQIAAILDSNQLKEKIKGYSLLGKYKEMKEQYELSRYLQLNKVPDSDKMGDIYIIPITEGTGPQADKGCQVSISYRGYFENHKTFDSIPENEPLDFAIGDSGQVLKGLEIGIKKMREGEKAKIIIPSHSAYGEKGSSTGIVPPYTTLVFEITMLKVKQALKK